VGNHSEHDANDAAEKRQIKPSAKAPDGAPITTEKDNKIKVQQENQTASTAKRFTGPYDVPFTIDMGDGQLVQDKRPIAGSNDNQLIASATASDQPMLLAQKVDTPDFKTDVAHTMNHVRELVHANNRHPESDNAMRQVLDDIANERRRNPDHFKDYLDLLNKTFAHEPGISNVFVAGTKFVDADMHGCVYGENPTTHNKFAYAVESGRLVAIEDQDRNHIRRVWDIHGHPLRVDKNFPDGSRDVYHNHTVEHFDAHNHLTSTKPIEDVLPTLLKEKYGTDLVSKLPDNEVVFAAAALLRKHLPELSSRQAIAHEVMNATDPGEAMAAALAYAFTESNKRDITSNDIDGMINNAGAFERRAGQIRELFKKGSIDTDFLPTNYESLTKIKQGQLPNCSVESVLAGLASTPQGRALLAGSGDHPPVIQPDVNGTYIVSFPGDQFDDFRINKPTIAERMIYSSCDGAGLYPAIIDKAFGERILNHMDVNSVTGELVDAAQAGGVQRNIIPGVASHFAHDNASALQLFTPGAPVDSVSVAGLSDAQLETAIVNGLRNGRVVTSDTSPTLSGVEITTGNTTIELDGSHALTILQCSNGEVTLYDPHGELVDNQGRVIAGSDGTIRHIPIRVLRDFLRDINVER
jgi:hypothetical protein